MEDLKLVQKKFRQRIRLIKGSKSRNPTQQEVVDRVKEDAYQTPIKKRKAEEEPEVVQLLA